MNRFDNILEDIDAGLDKYKPSEIVKLLDQHIIGQDQAKRLVAIALRNRIRRKHVEPELQEEISPKNILMIGPTGVGKTEIARRMAQMVNAPFIKVEATKFSERGYVGRDVEHMIRSLINHAVNQVKSLMREQARTDIEKDVKDTLEKAIWNELLDQGEIVQQELEKAEKKRIKAEISRKLAAGEYENMEINVKLAKKSMAIFPMVDMFPGMEDMETNFQSLFGGDGGMQAEEDKRVLVKEARDRITQKKMDEHIDNDRAIELGLKWGQEMGIIFIDEIDKISDKMGGNGPDVSREGVQRDLLPIIEGSTVNTKYGVVKTDHMLFIAAGAFHVSKPSDMIPELQGRFPIRVELSSLTKKDLRRILTEPKNSLVTQYQALLRTEGISLKFSEKAYDTIVDAAHSVNHTMEDIGARRLHTILEYLMEDISFEAPDLKKKSIEIDEKYVSTKLKEMIKDRDITRYIL